MRFLVTAWAWGLFRICSGLPIWGRCRMDRASPGVIAVMRPKAVLTAYPAMGGLAVAAPASRRSCSSSSFGYPSVRRL